MRRARFRALRGEPLAALGIELTVVGHERIPECGVLSMWNQTSHLDHLILPCVIERPTKVLYDLEVSRVPVYGEWLRRNGHDLVDRSDEAQWRAQIERTAERIAARLPRRTSPAGAGTGVAVPVSASELAIRPCARDEPRAARNLQRAEASTRIRPGPGTGSRGSPSCRRSPDPSPCRGDLPRRPSRIRATSRFRCGRHRSAGDRRSASRRALRPTCRKAIHPYPVGRGPTSSEPEPDTERARRDP